MVVQSDYKDVNNVKEFGLFEMRKIKYENEEALVVILYGEVVKIPFI